MPNTSTIATKPPCFLLDGKDVPASEKTLKALDALGAAMLEDARKADGPDNEAAWAWCHVRLGDLVRDVMTFEFGGEDRRPADLKGAVGVSGAR